MKLLEIKNVKKSYGSLKAVDGVSFDIEKGEIFGLLGPNGAGKTTLISTIMTLEKMDQGEILSQAMTLKKNPIWPNLRWALCLKSSSSMATSL